MFTVSTYFHRVTILGFIIALSLFTSCFGSILPSSFPAGLGGADLAPASTFTHLLLIPGNQITHLHGLKGRLSLPLTVTLMLIILWEHWILKPVCWSLFFPALCFVSLSTISLMEPPSGTSKVNSTLPLLPALPGPAF